PRRIKKLPVSVEEFGRKVLGSKDGRTKNVRRTSLKPIPSRGRPDPNPRQSNRSPSKPTALARVQRRGSQPRAAERSIAATTNPPQATRDLALKTHPIEPNPSTRQALG